MDNNIINNNKNFIFTVLFKNKVYEVLYMQEDSRCLFAHTYTSAIVWKTFAGVLQYKNNKQ